MKISFNSLANRLPTTSFSSDKIKVSPPQADALLLKSAWNSDVDFLNYWKAFFHQVNLSVNDEALKSINADIDDCSLILEQGCRNAQTLKNAIEAGLQKRGSFVFPLKVSKENNGPSEFIMCRFFLGQDGRLRCRLMEKSLSPLQTFRALNQNTLIAAQTSSLIRSSIARSSIAVSPLVRIHNEPHKASPCINLMFQSRELPRFSLPACDYTKQEVRELFSTIGNIDEQSPVLRENPDIPVVSAWTPARNELEQGLKLVLCDTLYSAGVVCRDQAHHVDLSSGSHALLWIRQGVVGS